MRTRLLGTILAVGLCAACGAKVESGGEGSPTGGRGGGAGSGASAGSVAAWGAGAGGWAIDQGGSSSVAGSSIDTGATGSLAGSAGATSIGDAGGTSAGGSGDVGGSSSALACGAPKPAGAPSPYAAACGLPPVDVSDATTVAQLTSQLVGDWIRCDGSVQAFPSGPSDLGVSFDADGQWYELVAAPNGGVQRAAAPSGTWYAQDPGLNGPGTFAIGTSGEGANAWLGTCPGILMLDDNGVQNATYGAAGGSVCVPTAPAPEALSLPALACAPPPGAPSSLTTVADYTAAVVGRWTTCSGMSLFGAGDCAVGLEIVADGTYYELYPAGAGHVTRGLGLAQRGTWSISNALANGAGNFQIDMVPIGGFGSEAILGWMEECPRRFSASNNGVLNAILASDDGPSCAQAAGTTIDFQPAAACSQTAVPVEPSSVDDMKSLVEGTWTLCSGTSPFPAVGMNDIGLQIAADGTWNRLFPASAGQKPADGAGRRRRLRRSDDHDERFAARPAARRSHVREGPVTDDGLLALTPGRRLPRRWFAR
jgi:hypothetical protein